MFFAVQEGRKRSSRSCSAEEACELDVLFQEERRGKRKWKEGCQREAHATDWHFVLGNGSEKRAHRIHRRAA